MERRRTSDCSSTSTTVVVVDGPVPCLAPCPRHGIKNDVVVTESRDIVGTPERQLSSALLSID